MGLKQWNGSGKSTICNYGFRFTETAERDLDEILSYITEKLCNPLAAAVFFTHLKDKIKEICHYPYGSPEINNQFIDSKSLRKMVVDSYLIYYLIQDERKNVIILRIVYGPRNQTKIQKNLHIEK